ncbi:MAG TPA: glycoside hydrolase family 15 protein, partial [Fodinibius sp.]|nr:glycoside hydrolase family 15 protein [Fodinibius sp.]
ITDPYRDTVLQKTVFKPKKKSSQYHLYALLAPHINNEGHNNSGWIGKYKGIPMLFAQNGDITLALACSTGWLKRSVGYVGASDGWTDLQQHKKMEWEYEHVPNGNIALTGEIDISDQTDFTLALSFGRTQAEAANQARASLLEGFDSAKKAYIDGWQAWQGSLRDVKGKKFRNSAAVLRMQEAKKFPGGIIASLSIPWGQSKGDSDKGGYHLVWPRDLVESAGGFLALQTHNDVLRIVNYLMSTQNADGSWPQNMWLQGEPNWNSLQMDEIALPILEIHKAYEREAIDKNRMKRYWPLARKAIAFLVRNGPYTPQDRWEEEQGYTPFTMATEIAGLLAGAELAEINNEKDLATYCREVADCWNEAIERKTYVRDTALAKEYDVDGYYIRINPFKDITASQLGDRTMNLKNHNGDDGKIKISELVSVDALALVRFGLRAADDPKIQNTIKVIDAVLKADTPNGACWHRYNNDGYGEHENGDAYDGTGIGRAWPLLTGERGHYEVAAGNIDAAKELLKAMEKFSNNGLLSEQIWDSDDIQEKGLYCGEHTGSAMPLTWAHAEYLKLCCSIAEEEIFDMPSYTRERYINEKTTCSFEIWRFENQLKVISDGKDLRVEVMAKANVIWTDDDWETKKSTKTKDTGLGIYVADLKLNNKKADKIEFTFYWEKADKWEGKNYSVKIR